MGCYDTVLVECPHCTFVNNLQSKSGRCRLETFKPQNAPVEILAGILGDHKCEHCKCLFTLTAVAIVQVRKKASDDD